MSDHRLAVVGAGGHALIVLDILEQMGGFDIAGLIDATLAVGTIAHGYPVLGDDSILPDLYAKGLDRLALGVGGFRSNRTRKAIFERLKRAGFSLESAIHPRSRISPRSSLGEGCCVFAGVTINPACTIAHNVIIATNSSIDHETVIESHVLISAGCTIGGNVVLGEGSLIAIGSTIASGVKVGAGALVAAGAVAISDVPSGMMVAGVPAMPIKPAP